MIAGRPASPEVPGPDGSDSAVPGKPGFVRSRLSRPSWSPNNPTQGVSSTVVVSRQRSVWTLRWKPADVLNANADADTATR